MIAFEWLTNYLIHSTLLMALAWGSRALPELRPAGVQDVIWKAALLAGLVTASIQTFTPLGSPGVRQTSVGAPSGDRSTAAAAGPATALEVRPIAADPGGVSDVLTLPVPVRSQTVHPQAARTEAARAGLDRAGHRFGASASERPGEAGPVDESRSGAWLPDARVLGLAAWLAGAAWLLLALARQLGAERRMLADRRPVTGAEREALCGGLRLPATVRLSISDAVFAPLATRRGEIVVPMTFETLPAGQRAAALAHEHAHLLRGDPQWRLLALVVARLCFVQPLNRVAVQELSRHAETLSDVLAVRATGGHRRALVDCLAHFAQRSRPGLPATVCGMAAGRLPERIEALLARQDEGERGTRSVVGPMATACLLGAVALPGVSAGPAWDSTTRVSASLDTEVPAPAAPSSEPRELVVAPPAPPTARPPATRAPSPAPAAEPRAVTRAAPGAEPRPERPPRQVRPTRAAAPAAPADGYRVRADHIRGRGGRWEMSVSHRDHRRSLKVQAEGEIRFDEAFENIVAIDDGGYFSLRVDEGGDERRLTIRGEADGSLSHDYRIDGDRAPWDDAAQDWFAGLLVEVFRVTGLAADARVAHLLEQGGARAVIDELDAIDSDLVSRLYISALSAAARLTPRELDAVLDHVGEAIGSDLETRLTLATIMDTQALEASGWRQLLATTTSVGSDLEQRLLLTHAAKLMPAEPRLLDAYLVAVDTIGSDLERRLTLVAFGEHLAGAEPAQLVRAVEAVRDIGSDLETRLALAALIPHLDDDEAKAAAIDAAGSIGSDREARLAFENLVHEGGLGPDLQASLVNTAARSLGSDFELRMLLLTVLDRGEVPDTVEAAVEDALRHIGSDFERNQVTQRLLDGSSARLPAGPPMEPVRGASRRGFPLSLDPTGGRP